MVVIVVYCARLAAIMHIDSAVVRCSTYGFDLALRLEFRVASRRLAMAFISHADEVGDGWAEPIVMRGPEAHFDYQRNCPVM
jgi:hypothetical protein